MRVVAQRGALPHAQQSFAKAVNEFGLKTKRGISLLSSLHFNQARVMMPFTLDHLV